MRYLFAVLLTTGAFFFWGGCANNTGASNGEKAKSPQGPIAQSHSTKSDQSQATDEEESSTANMDVAKDFQASAAQEDDQNFSPDKVKVKEEQNQHVPSAPEQPHHTQPRRLQAPDTQDQKEKVADVGENIRPFFIVLMGRVNRRDLRSAKFALDRLSSPKYRSTWLTNETPVSWSVNQIKVLDRTIAEMDPEHMAAFKYYAEKAPGLHVVYRPIDQVQASLSLDVLDVLQEPIITFELGDARNVVDLSKADLNNPPSYLFVDADGKVRCRIVDSSCLKYLSDRGFLDDKQDFKFKTADGYRRRQASAKEIIRYLLSQSLASVDTVTRQSPQVRQGFHELRILRKHIRNAYHEKSGSAKTDFVGGLALNINGVKLSLPKSPEGDLPLNSDLVYASTSDADKAFVHDTPQRYLFELPIHNIESIESATSEEAAMFSLRDYYSSMLNVLN